MKGPAQDITSTHPPQAYLYPLEASRQNNVLPEIDTTTSLGDDNTLF